MLTLKTPAEIEIMAEAGKRLARILEILKAETEIGKRTDELDRSARLLIKEAGAKPAFLGYTPGGAAKPFPAAICASVNQTVVHGLPSDYALREGDLLKIDIGLIYRGFYSDMAVTIPVGKVSREAEKLVSVTEQALYLGIKEACPGKSLGDIGHAINRFVRANDFSVAEGLSGHGIGRDLHEEPYVLNFGVKGRGEKLQVGEVIAIEPMVTVGLGKTKCLPDDSYVTADNGLAAHFEHTVAITEHGPRILTVGT